MFQRDYIVRQLQQLTQVLARVLFRKENHQFEEALAEIQEAGQLHLQLNLDNLRVITYDDLVAALHLGDHFDTDTASYLAELLRQQGELHLLLHHAPEDAHLSFEHALHLYLDVFFEDARFRSPDFLARIDALLHQTETDAFSLDTQRRLFLFYETTGRFDKAEDTLFSMAEHPNADCLAEGLAFFERLRKLPLAKLRRGGLPYKEVEEGRLAFRQLFGRE